MGLVVAGVAGCSGMGNISDTGTGGSGNNPGGGGSNPSGGSTGTGGATNPGTGGAPMVNVVKCEPGIPISSQVPRITRLQYDTVVKDLLGVTTVAGAAPSEALPADSDGSLTEIGWNGYMQTAEKIAADVMANPTAKAKFISCDPAQAACLTTTIKDFGKKMFRRQLTTAEVADFEKFNNLTPKGQPAEVAEAILYAFLASPSFIMRPEIGTEKEGTNFKLTSSEVAARLSFLLWNSVPDADLTTAAEGNTLGTKDAILAQAKRMLASPKAAAVAKSFHQAYADITNGGHWVNNSSHDATKYPSFTKASYVDSMAELDSFFQDVTTSGGTFKDLMTSPTAFVTKDTAAIYGLKAADFTTAKKTALDPVQRPGFLTRIGFLSTHAQSLDTSPILRGAFITSRVLGIPTGDPLPGVAGAKPSGTFTTNRDAINSLTTPEPCGSCHIAKINPPGYVLERYNAVGAWQDTDRLGGAINSTADVMLSTSLTKTITSPSELMAEIAKLPTAQRIYAERWVAYASNRNPNVNDACTVNTLAKNMESGTYSIVSMMADYTQADSFRLRAAGN